MKNLKAEIIEIITKYIFDKKILAASPENPRIIDDLRINSARVVDIILDIEEKYSIEVNDNELESISTLDDIVKLVFSKVNKKNSSK